MVRPFFRYSLSEIKDHYLKNQSDPVQLKAILHELTFRKTSAAKSFLATVQKKCLTSPPVIQPIPKKSNSSNTHVSSPATNYKKPTLEQLEAIDFFSSQESLKVNAFAGTGKTTTLVEMAKTTSRAGLYLAFNKAISEEARLKFPSSVNCRTSHSLAFQTVKSSYRECSSDKLVGSINGNAVASILNLSDVTYDSLVLRKNQLGYLILSVLRKFLYSDSNEITGEHFSRSGKLIHLIKEQKEELSKNVIDQANKLWLLMISPKSDIPLGHDGYLKVWALTNPTIYADYIMLDEAQDSNPVLLKVLSMQNAQIVYVGDRHQQIYEWRGAVNAMEKITSKYQSYLTTSFRFGNTIAHEANKVLQLMGEQKFMKGNSAVRSQLGSSNPQAILARTNAALIQALIKLIQSGKKPAIVGGTHDLVRLLKGVELLQENKPCDVPEFFGYKNWQEVVEFSQSDDGISIRTFVKLVESNGLSTLFGFLRASAPDEKSADIILTTTHKAKGREWDRVELIDDFTVARKDDSGNDLPVNMEELRILYVAMTRGKTEINLPPSVVKFLNSNQAQAKAESAGLYQTNFHNPISLLNSSYPVGINNLATNCKEEKSITELSIKDNTELTKSDSIFNKLLSFIPGRK